MLLSRRLFVKILGASIALSLGLPGAIISAARIFLKRERRMEESKPSATVETIIANNRICLPMPRLEGTISLERALANRRSIRDYLDEPLTLEELSQLLWSAYGITETRYGFKTTPSAGATYPLEIYAVIAPRGVVAPEGFLEPGSYHYDPHSHCMNMVRRGNLVEELYHAALDQPWVLKAPVNIVITADYTRTTRVYGARGIQYVHIEVGHAGQNIYLQATALGLATVAIGAFYDNKVQKIVGAPANERPLYIMPIGRPRRPYHLTEEQLAEYIKRHRKL